MSSLLDSVPTLIEQFKQASERELSPSLVEEMERWGTPPKALEILYLLDMNAYFALSSGFVTKILIMLYDEAVASEGTTDEAVREEAQKRWRNDSNYASKMGTEERPDFN